MNPDSRGDDAGVNVRIEDFLKRLEIKHGKTTIEGKDVFGVPWVIDGKDFLVMIQAHDEWIWLSCAILLEPDHPKEAYPAFLMECLRANHDYPEISFDVDEHGTLGTSRDVYFPVMNSDLGFIQFKQAFFAIPATIKHFLGHVAPRFSIEVPGFREMTETFIKKVQE